MAGKWQDAPIVPPVGNAPQIGMGRPVGVSDNPDLSGLADIGKSIGSGLVTGTEGLMGLPGDIAQKTLDAATWADRLPYQLASPAAQQQVANFPTPSSPLPTKANWGALNQQVTGFTPYESQTQLGDVAGHVASMVPGGIAFSASPFQMASGGLGANIASAPFRGTEWEGPADVLGAMVGGMGAAGTEAKLAAEGESVGQAALHSFKENALHGMSTKIPIGLVKGLAATGSQPDQQTQAKWQSAPIIQMPSGN